MNENDVHLIIIVELIIKLFIRLFEFNYLIKYNLKM